MFTLCRLPLWVRTALIGISQCLDTEQELESCGGCMHGELHSNGTLDYSGPGNE